MLNQIRKVLYAVSADNENNQELAEWAHNQIDRHALTWLRAQDAEITRLLSSEQAWREMVESHGPEGRNYTNSQYVALLTKFNQAIEVLKWYADESVYDPDHLSKHGYIIIDKDAGQRARYFLSSLSQKGEKKVCPKCETTKLIEHPNEKNKFLCTSCNHVFAYKGTEDKP